MPSQARLRGTDQDPAALLAADHLVGCGGPDRGAFAAGQLQPAAPAAAGAQQRGTDPAGRLPDPVVERDQVGGQVGDQRPATSRAELLVLGDLGAAPRSGPSPRSPAGPGTAARRFCTSVSAVSAVSRCSISSSSASSSSDWRRFSEASSCCSASSSRAGPRTGVQPGLVLALARPYLLDVLLQPGDVTVQVVDRDLGPDPLVVQLWRSPGPAGPARRARAGYGGGGRAGPARCRWPGGRAGGAGLRDQPSRSGLLGATMVGTCTVHGSVSRSEATVRTPSPARS